MNMAPANRQLQSFVYNGCSTVTETGLEEIAKIVSSDLEFQMYRCPNLYIIANDLKSVPKMIEERYKGEVIEIYTDLEYIPNDCSPGDNVHIMQVTRTMNPRRSLVRLVFKWLVW